MGLIEILTAPRRIAELEKEKQQLVAEKADLLRALDGKYVLDIGDKSKEVKRLDNEISEKMKLLMQSRHDIEQAEAQLGDVRETYKEAERKIEAAQAYLHTREFYITENAALETRLAEKQSEIVQAKEQLATFQRQAEGAKQKYLEKYEALVKCEAETKKLQCSAHEAHLTIEAAKQYERKREEYDAECTLLADELRQRREETVKTKKELESTQADCNNVKRSHQKSKAEYEALVNDLMKVREKRQHLIDEDSVLANKIAESRENLCSIQSDIAAKHKGLKKLSEDINTSRSEILELSDKNTVLKNTVEELQSRADKLSSNLERVCADAAVMAILESDLEAGYVSEWAPDLFKRMYRYDNTRAQQWLLRVLPRHPQPESFQFDEASLGLTVDGTPIEKLFAAVYKAKLDKGSSEKFLGAWEKYVQSSQ